MSAINVVSRINQSVVENKSMQPNVKLLKMVIVTMGQQQKME